MTTALVLRARTSVPRFGHLVPTQRCFHNRERRFVVVGRLG